MADAISSQLPTHRLNQIDSWFVRKSANWTATSGPTSKQHGPIPGPIATTRSSGRLPNCSTHGLHRFRHDLGHHSAPSGVNRSHRAVFADPQSESEDNRRFESRGRHRAALRSAHRLRPRPRRFDQQYAIGVNLFRGSQFDRHPGHPALNRVPKPCWSQGKSLERLRSKNVVAVTPEQSSL